MEEIVWFKRSWKHFKLKRWGMQSLAEVTMLRYCDGTSRWLLEMPPKHIRTAGKFAGVRPRVFDVYRTKKEAMDRAIAQMVIDRLEE